MSLMPGNLVVPLAVLHKKAPVHRICKICILPDTKVIITGTIDGQICVWKKKDQSEQEEYLPKYMLFGNTTTITCLASAGVSNQSTNFISCAQSGKICLWNAEDGRCLESALTHYIHTSAQAHAFATSVQGKTNLRLLCVGHYSEILALDPETLQITFVLSSRVEPDWISAFCVVKPAHKPDIVVGVSNAGMVKIWTLSSIENKTMSTPIYEDESKQVQCFSACSLILCPFNPRTMLVVSQSVWQVFDAFDFSMCCSGPSDGKGSWLGGDFVSVDKVIIWASTGCAYLYQLPKKPQKGDDRGIDSHQNPFYYGILKVSDKASTQNLFADAAFSYRLNSIFLQNVQTSHQRFLARGDGKGSLSLWIIPFVDDEKIELIKKQASIKPLELLPDSTQSLSKLWKAASDQCPGILGCYDEEFDGNDVDVTTTLYVASRGYLVLGRRDGSIIIVNGIRTLSRLFLDLDSSYFAEKPAPLRLLSAHNGAVTCLLYPYDEDPRYEPNHLVSGGADFSVCLLDLFSDVLLYKFCVQAGEILRLLVPPPNCTTKVSQSICSVATDHSVAMLNLKDQRCILLASRHLFPVVEVKWRPLDDFLLVRCEDNTVYVWQIETANLDRVLNGIVAEEALIACREQLALAAEERAEIDSQKRIIAPGSRIFDWRRHLEESPPMIIQGVQCNEFDAEFHVILFSIESLIVSLIVQSSLQLQNSESATLKEANIVASLESQFPTSASTSPSIVGVLSRAKETAGQVLRSGLAARDEFIKTTTDTTPISSSSSSTVLYNTDLSLEIAHLLTSLLQSWASDQHLDQCCRNQLGMRQPKRPATFGLVSKEGHLTICLPERGVKVGERRWKISRALTTQHLLALVAMADAGISADGLSFNDNYERTKRVVKRLPPRQQSLRNVRQQSPMATPQPARSEQVSPETMGRFLSDQSQIKQAWNTLASVHCLMLSDLVAPPCDLFRAPLIELLARRWRDRCPQIRDAAQTLLLRELNRIGPEGRKALVEKWSQYLPTTIDSAFSILTAEQTQTLVVEESAPGLDKTNPNVEAGVRSMRRNQATAVIVLGIVGAEYGAELISKAQLIAPAGVRSPPEGFSNDDYALARATSQSLLELLLQPPSQALPPFAALRRAAVDLIGRGFAVWQPYLDISKVLLALLELCSEADRLLPPMTSSAPPLPLSPEADACAAARRALTLIAAARPPAFITALGKEVTRFNAMSQHQTVNVGSPLVRAKSEILRIIEMITDKMYSDMVDLMIPTGEVLVHCMDPAALKRKNIAELFPFVTKFPMISYCSQSRRLAFGGKSGSIVIHELRIGKSQTIQAHSKPVTSCSFCEDGKYLATYSTEEGKMNFWQISQPFMGMGQSQLKCIKQHQAPTAFSLGGAPGAPVVARLNWISAKAVTLSLPNGAEHRFSL